MSPTGAATPTSRYRRSLPDRVRRQPPTDLSAVAGLAAIEVLGRLGRDLPIRLHTGTEVAELPRWPAELRHGPVAPAAARLRQLLTPAATGSAAAGSAERLDLLIGGAAPAGAPGRPGTAAVTVSCLLAGDLRVAVTVEPGDPWERSAAAVAELVAEVLAELLADPAARPDEAAGIGAASRRRVLTELAGAVVDQGPFRPLAALVEAQVDRNPRQPAVFFGGRAISYGRLDRLANGLARRLADAGVRRGAAVPVLLGNSRELPVAWLALLKLGAAFVPLDPRWPAHRVRTALDVVRSPVVLTATGAAPEGCTALPVCAADLPEEPRRPGVPVGPTDPAYGVFTSGTTGTPRCAVNHHAGLVNRLRFMSRYFAATGAEVVLQNSKHTFDSAVWQIFWPLITGGWTVVPAHGDFLDIDQTIATIAAHRVTITDFVPTTFNLLVSRVAADPAALAGIGTLRHLIVGGEAINPRMVHRLRELLPEVRVTNGYGPSETSIGMVFHPVQPEDGDEVPLGRPIDNCYAVVVDGRLRPLPPGAVGEIAIGGVCVGAGYLDAPRQTAERFVANPLPELPGPRLYRSGDLGWYDPAGRLHFAGRADFQAKVGGVRVELGEIQVAAESCPGVRQAAVLVGAVDLVGAESARGLAVFACGDGTVTEAAVRAHLRGLLPRTQLPRYCLVLPELPVTDNGKVDRAALATRLRTRLASARQQADPAGAPDDGDRILRAFRLVLGDPAVQPRDDFLTIGGDSLHAVALVAALRDTFGVDLGVPDLLEHPSPELMHGFVERQRVLAAARGPRPLPEVGRDEAAAMARDAAAPLPPGLTSRAAATVAGPGAVGFPEAVLVTGATGFVGGRVVAELLRSTTARVVCLSRADDDRAAQGRLVRALRERGSWREEYAERLVGVAADLAAPGLGLDPGRWRQLAADCDAVLHCGALVNFLYDYRAHRAANVLGTRELLRLARHDRPARLHHVSTLGVLEPEAERRPEPVPEDVDPARVVPPRSGYSRSKWVAERYLHRARAAGAGVTVLRLGEVMPAADDGRPNSRALTHLLLTAFARLRACPDLSMRTDYTPLDWAARLVVACLRDPDTRDRDLHLLHPESVCLTAVLPRAGVPLDRVPPAEFLRRLDAAADERRHPALGTLARLLRGLGRDGRSVPALLGGLVADNPRLFRADTAQRLATRHRLEPVELDGAISAYAQRLADGPAGRPGGWAEPTGAADRRAG